MRFAPPPPLPPTRPKPEKPEIPPTPGKPAIPTRGKKSEPETEEEAPATASASAYASDRELIVPTVATGPTNGMAVPELARVVKLQSDLSKIARIADQDSRGTTAEILASLPVSCSANTPEFVFF